MTEIEKLYSEAFENGVNYAIEKMFADEEKKENIFKRGWDKVKGLANKGVEDFKSADWKGKTWRAAIPTAAVAVPTVLAIRHHNKKKAAEAEAEKNYSEGFLDGVGYAQKMFGDEEKKENIFKRGWDKLTNDIWEKDKGLRDGEGDAKKLNWKRLGKRAGVIGGGTALVAVPTALAIRHHNKKKAEAEAEN